MLKIIKYIPIPLILLIISSCGYRYQTVSGNMECSVHIKEIRNSTFIPGIEDRLRYVLTDELIKNGCNLRDNEGSITITGRIEDVQMDIVAEKEGKNFYEINIISYFSIVIPDKKIIERKVTHPFLSDYVSGITIEEIMAMRDREMERLLRDISKEVIMIIKEGQR